MQETSWVLAVLAHQSSKSKVKELGGYERDLFFIVDACLTATSKMCLYRGSMLLISFFVLPKLRNLLASCYGLVQELCRGEQHLAHSAGKSWAHQGWMVPGCLQSVLDVKW